MAMASLQRSLVVLVVLLLAVSAPVLWLLQRKATAHFTPEAAQQDIVSHVTHGGPNSSKPTQRQAMTAATSGTLAGRHEPMRPSLLVEVPMPDMRRSRQRVLEYLQSAEFKQRQGGVLAQQDRGILVSAGGRRLLTQLVVMLKVLREHLKCTLPVQVAWHGPQEMDQATLNALDLHFGPVTGFDVTQVLYAAHHRPVRLEHWVGKVFALLHCSFREVLLLDADNLPLLNPEPLFNRQRYRRYGALFWPDLWEGWVGEGAWKLVGLDAAAAKAELRAGKGLSRRDAESGQLLIDRGRHLDALEATFWVNSWADRLYHKHLHGDKDTFALGFALVGKAHMYRQVHLPPGGAFRWGPGQLELKAGHKSSAAAPTGGWQLVGCVQYDDVLSDYMDGGADGRDSVSGFEGGGSSASSSGSRSGGDGSGYSSASIGSSTSSGGSSGRAGNNSGGSSSSSSGNGGSGSGDSGSGSRYSNRSSTSRHSSRHIHDRHLSERAQDATAAVPLFLHRTMNKMQLGEEPWPLELVTGPIPDRWARYYIAHNSQGPTKGTGWQHVAPSDALHVLQLNPEPQLALPTTGSWVHATASIIAEVAGMAAKAAVPSAPVDSLLGAGTIEGCPLVRIAEYVQFRQLGLPLDHNSSLEAACGGPGVLQLGTDTAVALGPQHLEGKMYKEAGEQLLRSSGDTGRKLLPGDRGGGALDSDGVRAGRVAAGGGVAAAGQLDGGANIDFASSSSKDLVPDGTPLAALRVDAEAAAASSAVRAVQASVEALVWLEAHVKDFPVIDRGP